MTIRRVPLMAMCFALLVLPSVSRADTPQISSAENSVRYIDPMFGVVETKDISFGSSIDNFGNVLDLKLDLFEPASDTETARPVIIWVHGGGFKGGTKEDGNMRALATGFAERGWVSASISYRLRPNGTPGSMTNPELLLATLAGDYPTQMQDAQHDAQAAVRWFRANAQGLGIDPSLIMMGGGSAGAITATEVLFNPEDPGESGNPGFDSSIQAAVSLWGASDLRRIESGAGPLLQFHGTNDTTVPYALAVETCAATRAKLNHCDLVTYPGEGHGPWKHRDEILVESSAWLASQVLGINA